MGLAGKSLGGCRSKKLIIAGTLLYNDMQQARYTCSICTTQEKKEQGCKRRRRDAILVINCICEGKQKCAICKGSNKIELHRCPRVILAGHEIARVAPYFFNWINSEYREYPDGRGRYFQPSKMVEAFEILLSVRNREHEIMRKRNERPEI